MRLLIALLVLVCFASTVSAGSPGKIVGGTVANHGQFPWLCRLKIPNPVTGGVGLCGASIIQGGYYVMTAGHCFDANITAATVYGITCEAGVVNDTATLSATYQIRSAVWLKVHPLFNESNHFHYDYALLRMSFPFTLGNHVSAIPLATDYPDSGDTVYAAGWGATSQGGDQSTLLLWTGLPYHPLSTCQEIFDDNLISGVQICAGGVVGQDTCQGDSGGPLFTASNITKPHDATLLGITSFGIGCGGDTAGVYSDIPTTGTKWVARQINSPNCRTQCYQQNRRCLATQINTRLCRNEKRRCFLYCGSIGSTTL